MSFECVVQQAIFERLSTDSAVLTAAVGVFDEVPQAADSGSIVKFPYIVIGDDHAIAWDTDTENGAQITATIHTWSRHLGRKEIKELQGLVYGALHNSELYISGFVVVLCQWTDSDSFLDAGGLSRHGVQKFNILIEKT